MPSKTKLPALGLNDSVPLLDALPRSVRVLAPIVSELPLPTDKSPPIVRVPVQPVATHDIVPAPVDANDRFPLTVVAVAPDAAEGVQLPDVLSNVRFP